MIRRQPSARDRQPPSLRVVLATWAASLLLPWLPLVVLNWPLGVGTWTSLILTNVAALVVTTVLLVARVPAVLIGVLLPFVLILSVFAGGSIAESYGVLDEGLDLFNGWTLWIGAIWAVMALVLVCVISGVRLLAAMVRHRGSDHGEA